MKRYMILLIWITAILFPLTWVGRLLPGLRYSLWPLVRPLISPEWVHVVAHAVLYAGLALLLAFSLRLPRNWLSALFLFFVVITLGLGQEGLQLVAKGRSFGKAEVFDLGVDMLGGLLGWWLWGKINMLHWIRLRL